MYNSYGYENPGMDCISQAELNIILQMRLLWEQHTAWTRMTINSIVFSLPNERQTTARLLRNPKDFADAFRLFYGDTIASKLGDLLTEHLVLAAQLVKAAKADNGPEADAIERKWYDNADAIANLLGMINPYWTVEEWRAMLYEHLRLVKAEAVDLLRGNYQAAVDDYDEAEAQALIMADTLSSGIIMQFPERFHR